MLVFLLFCLVFLAAERSSGADKQLTIAMMPKSKGNAYFISCRKGAEQAAKDLGVKLLWDGPTEPDPARQNEIVETWITRGVDVIAVSVENKEGLSTALRKAKEKGIKIITWDADAEADARDFLINQATPEGIGYTLMDEAAKALGDKGEFAIITSSLTAANQNEWIKYIKQRMEEKYPASNWPPCVLRRSKRQGIQRGDRYSQLESERQGHHGGLSGGSRCCRSRQSGRKM
jgi:rhamnose transport system permease protein